MSGKDIGLLGLCVISAIVAIWQFWEWIGMKDAPFTHWKVIVAIACLVVAFVCGLLFLIPRVNKEEEIHITQ
jgi:CDP-diglyceride synthetase